MVEEPQLRAGVARRFDGFLPPLQHPSGLRERACLLHVRRRREQEHLRPAVVRCDLARLDLRTVFPERRALDLDEVAHHQPVQVGHAEPLQTPVCRADRGVLAQQEVAEHLAVDHVHHSAVRAVVAIDAWHVVEAVVVLRCRAFAPVLLEQRDHVRIGVAPEAFLVLTHDAIEVVGQRGVARLGHREIPGQQVEERRHVRRTLDARVPAQRDHTASGSADIAQQQLNDRPGADVLRPHRVLRPAHAVDQRSGTLAAGVLRPRRGDLQELVGGHAADPLDHLRCVARVMPLEDLVHAARVLQRRVGRDVVGAFQRRAARAVLIGRGALLLARRSKESSTRSARSTDRRTRTRRRSR